MIFVCLSLSPPHSHPPLNFPSSFLPCPITSHSLPTFQYPPVFFFSYTFHLSFLPLFFAVFKLSSSIFTSSLFFHAFPLISLTTSPILFSPVFNLLPPSLFPPLHHVLPSYLFPPSLRFSSSPHDFLLTRTCHSLPQEFQSRGITHIKIRVMGRKIPEEKAVHK